MTPWIKMWWSRNQSPTVLSAYRWFDHVFDDGNYLWTPPPPVVQIAVKQLCRNYYLWEKSLHNVCLMCLMTFLSKNQLSTFTNLIVTLPFDRVFLPQTNHEKLILEFFFPLSIEDLGSYREHNSWLIVKESYKRCGRRSKAWEGVV